MLESEGPISGAEINEYTESLIQCFYRNNSRLITTANEMADLGDAYRNNTVELKDGEISKHDGMIEIYGYCLGTYVQFTQILFEPNGYIITIINRHPLYGYGSEKFFRLYSALKIKTGDGNNGLEVIFDDNPSLNILHGSKERFLKWYHRALEKRFPMSRINNPLARFL
jgi:hypothetical protein